MKYGILIVAVGIVSALFHGIGLWPDFFWHIFYSDIVPFFEKAVAEGFPYIDRAIEYPVLTGLFVYVMGVIGGTHIGYYLATSVLLIAFAGAATYFLLRFRQWVPMGETVYYFWIAAPSMFFFLIYNWDIIAVFFVTAALYMMQKKNFYAAAFLLAAGFSSKFYPALYIIPLLLMQKETVKQAATLAVFGATVLAINGFFMIASIANWSHFFVFNSLRPPNPDSIWTVVQFLIGRPIEISTINILSFILFAAAYGIFLWRFRKMHPLFLSFGITLIFLFFNKVFSPQYILWLLPFFVLLPIKKRWFYALEFSNLLALFSILAWVFLGNASFYLWSALFFVVTRHIALFSIFIQVAGRKFTNNNLPILMKQSTLNI